MQTTDVIVIGGGLQGCSTALHLLRRGSSVIVLEKETSGRHASGVNAGGVRRLNRAIPEIPLSLASHEWWQRIESLVDHDCGFKPFGQVRIAENTQDMEKLTERIHQLESLGYTHEKIIDRNTLRELVPAVADHCVGGLHCPGDGFAEPYLASRAFMRKVISIGGSIYEHHQVTAIEKNNGNWHVHVGEKTYAAPAIVNCAGAWGAKIAYMIGDTAPVQPTALTMMVAARTPRFLKPVVGLASRKLSFKQMENGTVVIGGGHLSKLNLEKQRTTIDFTQLKISAQTVEDVFPIMKNVPIIRCWAGIEGILPDELPVIGPSPTAKNAYHAFGFSGHGFQLSPIIGQIVSELIIEGRSSLPIEAFRMERFDKNKKWV